MKKDIQNRGLTHREYADLMGLTETSVYRILSGKQKESEQLKRLRTFSTMALRAAKKNAHGK